MKFFIRIFSILILVLLAGSLIRVTYITLTRESGTKKLQDGDLIFLDLDCGELCDAIEDVTKRQFQVEGPNLSHVGILAREKGGWVVFEAWNGVQKSLLHQVRERTKNKIYIRRFHNATTEQITNMLSIVRNLIGKPYDEDFERDNGKYYCSELVAEAFNQAFERSLFDYQPMVYGDPENPHDASWRSWSLYFKKRDQVVPVGRPGISPLGIFLSPELEGVEN